MAIETRFCGAQTLLGYACPGHAITTRNGYPLCFWHATRTAGTPGAKEHRASAGPMQN